MLSLNPIILMLLGTQLNTSPNIQNLDYTNAIASNRLLHHPQEYRLADKTTEPTVSVTQQSQLNSAQIDIAQTFDGDCDKIDYVSDNYGLGLTYDEIEALGARHTIRLSPERLSRIHQIFAQYGGGSNTRAQGPDGYFWFIPDSYGLSSNPSSTVQVAQANKSVGKSRVDQKLASNKLINLLAQSGGGVRFGYNLGGWECVVHISLNDFNITY